MIDFTYVCFPAAFGFSEVLAKGPIEFKRKCNRYHINHTNKKGDGGSRNWVLKKISVLLGQKFQRRSTEVLPPP